jgi:hypothetical protein
VALTGPARRVHDGGMPPEREPPRGQESAPPQPAGPTAEPANPREADLGIEGLASALLSSTLTAVNVLALIGSGAGNKEIAELLARSGGADAVDDGPLTPPAPGATGSGFIDSGDGSNIRSGPAEAGGRLRRAQPLPPATRVFVSGTYPGADQWSYVTAYLPEGMVRGYVQGFRVATDLPEPTAKLYQVHSGDTAERIAAQEFSGAVEDGHDLRFYENVLLYVNRQKGRAGVTGEYQDPGLLGGGADNVQLVAGHRIWLVSPAYAAALRGVVPSGSLTGGAVAKARRFAQHLEDILASIYESRNHLDEVAGEYAQAIRDHLPEIIGIVAGFVAAEMASAFLAATPTGVGQIAAVLIQLALAAFGAAGLVEAGAQALGHAQQWLTLAWTATGRPDLIGAAAKEFLRMLVCIAMAALAYVGVKGNLGNAVKIAGSLTPPMAPAFAVAGGGRAAGSRAGTAVAVGPPTPFGPFGTAVAMTAEDDELTGSQHEGTEAAVKRASRLDELAKDWLDHAGKETRGTRAEAEAGLGLEEAGEIPGPIRRPLAGEGHSGDFVDHAGVDWDVKGPYSRSKLIEKIKADARAAGRREPTLDPARAQRGEFEVNDMIKDIRNELKTGENVIIDARGLLPADTQALRQAVEEAGLTAQVKIWP